MYHDIAVSLSNPAHIAIEGDILTITAGQWPDFAGPVDVPDVSETLLDSDSFVYLSRERDVVLSAEFVPYGIGTTGETNELLDLLAWKDGDGWHIKRLVPEASDA